MYGFEGPELGKTDEQGHFALTTLRKGLEYFILITTPHDAPAYLPARVALGLACSAGGKPEEAIEQWEEVLRMDPNHRTAQLYLKLARAQPPAAAVAR